MTSYWVRGIALILLCVVLAGEARGDTVFPVRTGHIVDEAGLLSQQFRNRLVLIIIVFNNPARRRRPERTIGRTDRAMIAER